MHEYIWDEEFYKCTLIVGILVGTVLVSSFWWDLVALKVYYHMKGTLL